MVFCLSTRTANQKTACVWRQDCDGHAPWLQRLNSFPDNVRVHCHDNKDTITPSYCRPGDCYHDYDRDDVPSVHAGFHG